MLLKRKLLTGHPKNLKRKEIAILKYSAVKLMKNQKNESI